MTSLALLRLCEHCHTRHYSELYHSLTQQPSQQRGVSQDGPLPLVPPLGSPPVTGLWSLALTVGSWAEPPVLTAPHLTELRMVGVGEHRPADAMMWLAGLPELQVLCSCLQ